jgi:hypothetical protein
MHARSSNSEAVSDAMEMAVLSSVQHPNIVQVFSCLTDMVYIEDGEPSPRANASQAPFNTGQTTACMHGSKASHAPVHPPRFLCRPGPG